MGWRDAPLVSVGGAPKWKTAPIVGIPDPLGPGSPNTPPPPGGGPQEDLGQYFASELGQGALRFGGIPGDIENLARRGIDWASNKLGISERATPEELDKAQVLPTGDALIHGWEDMSTPFYEPRTPIGKAAAPFIQAAPGAALAGLGNGASVLSNVFRYGMGPVATSEAAGAVAHNVLPSFEEPIRIGAGLLASGKSAAKLPIPKSLSAAMLRDAGGRFFRMARTRRVVLSPQSYGQFVQSLRQKMEDELMNKDNHPHTTGIVEKMEKLATGPLDLERLKNARTIAGEGTQLPNQSDARLSGMVTSAVDDYVNGLTPVDTVAGNVSGIGKMLGEGRKIWTQMHKAEDIGRAWKNARNSDQWSKGNKDQALRNKFRRIADADDFERRWTPEEQKAIRAVVDANSAEKVARIVGGGAPDRGLRNMLAGIGAGGVAGFAVGGPVGAGIGASVALPVSMIAERAANKMTVRQAQLAQAMAGGGKAEGGLGRVVRHGRNALAAANVQEVIEARLRNMAVTPPPRAR